MNRYCSIAGLFMLASVFAFSRPVPAESGHNVFREYSSFEACYESAKQGDAKAYEGMGDFMLHQGIFNPDKKAAAAWYTKAARYGRGSAAEKLRALGVSAPAVGEDRAPVWIAKTGTPASAVSLSIRRPIIPTPMAFCSGTIPEEPSTSSPETVMFRNSKVCAGEIAFRSGTVPSSVSIPSRASAVRRISIRRTRAVSDAEKTYRPLWLPAHGSILISDVHPAFAGGPDDRKEYPQG